MDKYWMDEFLTRKTQVRGDDGNLMKSCKNGKEKGKGGEKGAGKTGGMLDAKGLIFGYRGPTFGCKGGGIWTQKTPVPFCGTGEWGYGDEISRRSWRRR